MKTDEELEERETASRLEFLADKKAEEFRKVCAGELDTAHTLKEFANLPWSQMDDDWFQRCGGIGRGGICAGVDFNPYKPTISFVRDNGSVDRWAIPEELGKLIDKYKDYGRRDFKRELRNLLDLD